MERERPREVVSHSHIHTFIRHDCEHVPSKCSSLIFWTVESLDKCEEMSNEG
jgi:hypothetical protein